MPPTTKPQIKTKGAEEGKEKAGKKAKKAVAAALLLFVALAAFVEAQQQQGMPDADKALSGFKTIGMAIVKGVRTAIALAFWVAFAIMVTHFALGKISPTRFQRLGAFWDGLERAKDIIYGYAWLFLLIFAIYAAIGVITNGGTMDAKTFGDVVNWIMVEPITKLFEELKG
jgi:NADH:ubiquinone oxidoreductase subunit 6 (subunit J)